ncbi:unnamed protein product, partial [Meganyctiphanes norvegica]
MNGITWTYGRKIKVEMAYPPPNLLYSERTKTERKPNNQFDSSSANFSSEESSDSSLFKCEACCNRFNFTEYRPHSLPCGHTLCSQCINDKYRIKLFCPFCKTFCGARKAASDYPNNYFILKLLDCETKLISGPKKKLDPGLENLKQLELSQTVNHIYSCNDYLLDLKGCKKEQESKLKALQEDIS